MIWGHKAIILNSYNSGVVTYSGTASGNVGGIVPENGAGAEATDTSKSVIINSYNVGNMSTTSGARAIGRFNTNSAGQINNVYNYGTISGTGTNVYSFIQVGSTNASATVDNGYYIRQWRDVPMTYYIENESYQMEYWTVYCTSWNNVLESVWTGWGEKELQEYIDICSEYI